MNTWILICNESRYDIDGAFKKFRKLNWRQVPQLDKAEPGDVALIYVSSPKKIIAYRTVITKTNLLTATIDDSEFCRDLSKYSRYMEIELVKRIHPGKVIRRKDLIDHGLNPNNPMAGPIPAKGELKKFLESL